MFKADNCACLNSLINMVVTKMDNCKFVCNGSKRDPCGDARYYTVYEQKGIISNMIYFFTSGFEIYNVQTS